MKQGGSDSLKTIFTTIAIVLVGSFTLIFILALLNNFQTKMAIQKITTMEEKILFPVQEAVADISSAMIDLKEEISKKDISLVHPEYFTYQIQGARGHLENALNAMDKIGQENTDLKIPIQDTKKIVSQFSDLGAETISLHKKNLKAQQGLSKDIQQISSRLQQIQTDLSLRLMATKADDPEKKYLCQAINDLTAARTCIMEFRGCMASKAGTEKDKTCSEQLDGASFLMQNLKVTLPGAESEFTAIQKDLHNVSRAYSEVVVTLGQIKNRLNLARNMEEELSTNMELCKYAIITLNQRINRSATETLRNLTFILFAGLLICFLFCFLFLKWTREKLISPLVDLSQSVTGLGKGEEWSCPPAVGILEIDSLTKELEQMYKTLRTREKGLQDAEERWKTIFQAIGGPAFVLDTDLRIQEANHSFFNLAGAKKIEEIKGRSCREVLSDKITQCDCPLIEINFQNFNEPIKFNKDIQDTPFYFTVSPIHDAQGTLQRILVIGTDLSEVKRLEQKLQRAQKMEALGAMAGGVAHDLNNILAGLVTYPDLLLQQLPEDSPFRRPIEIIRRSGERASEVVQDLLTLARGNIKAKDLVDLNSIIEEYLDSPGFKNIEAEGGRFSVELNLAQDLMKVEGSSIHLMKMIMNLVTNAAEAISDRGIVRISTENVSLNRPVTGYDEIKPGNYVKLTIEDNGSGIAPEDLPHIFEPFYSKKTMGRSGSGLGMAIVWSTVEDHGGYIEVQSEQGKGTRFTIYLPASSKHPETAVHKEKKQEPPSWKGKNESILIIDDMEQQRSLVSEILSTLGYETATADSGKEAVKLCSQRCFDLIILDMILDADMDGLDTYREILKVCPGQKAIIVSGYSESQRVKETMTLGAARYLRKPYSMKVLSAAIRDVLKGED